MHSKERNAVNALDTVRRTGKQLVMSSHSPFLIIACIELSSLTVLLWDFVGI